ncbi:MAG: 2-phospho-L-lactate guanylyltransferase [Gaiellaceae bacterium]
MASIVVPFRGSGAKLRLTPVPERARAELALAMLGDLLAACARVGRTTLVTEDAEAIALARELDVRPLADPGGGQGAAVAAALAEADDGPILVVNADLPCAVPRDLRSLLRAMPAAGMALVAARDGTTNALGLSAAQSFAPLYGPGSADRFRARAAGLGLEAVSATIPNLADDVDTLADLQRVGLRAGPRTQAAISALGLAA